jgi:hypothetical protein
LWLLHLTGISKSNSEIMSQTILANSFKRGFLSFASNIDASAAAQDFSLAKAEATRNTSFLVMGKIAKKFLPILQGIFEAFIYSIFLIIIIMAMLPATSKVALLYIKALFWINLWPPLYAILNFCMTYFGQKSATAAVLHPGNGFTTGLSIMTSTGLGNVLADYSAIAGYLSLSIPMISWVILGASGGVMAGIASRLMEGFDSPVSQAATDATSGNIQLGQNSFDNQNSFQHRQDPSYSSGFISNTGSDGIQSKITTGGGFISSPSSSVPVEVDFSNIVSQSNQESLNNAKQVAQTSNSDLISSTMKLENATNTAIHSINSSKGTSESWSSNDNLSLSNISSETNRLTDDFSQRTGLSSSIINAVHNEMALSGGVDTPVIKLKAGVASRLGKSSNDISDEQITQSIGFLSSKDYTNAKRSEAVQAKSLLSKIDSTSSDINTNSLTQALSNNQNALLRKSKSFQELNQVSSQVNHMNSIQSAIKEKGTDGMINWMIDHKGFPESEVKKLFSHYHRGQPEARQEFFNLSKEYVQSYKRSEKFNEQSLEKNNDITDNYKNNKSTISNSLNLSTKYSWPKDSQFKSNQSKVDDKFKSQSNQSSDLKSIKAGGEIIKESFQNKKASSLIDTILKNNPFK